MVTIKLNSRGDEVKLLQTKLGITADGIFGKNTEAAVKKFQEKNNLTPDGIVGPATWSKLGVGTTTASNSKVVDPSVVYMPLSVHVTKSANRPINYLAIHYTAGGSSASGRARSIYNVFKSRSASADFAVDDKEMVQFNPDLNNYYCWAVGDKRTGAVNVPSGSNRNTISIEVCSNLTKGTSASKPNHDGWYFTDAALDNTLKLCRILMSRFNIPLSNVVRHYDISGKLCPGIVGWNKGRLYNKDGTVSKNYNNESEWLKFKERLK